MKALSYLNKYLLKYKWYLILGTLFTAISNLFGIFPAQLVRYALIWYAKHWTFITSTINRHSNRIYTTYLRSVFCYLAYLTLILALLKGFFLFLVRQTLIVMSRHVEYDLKNEIYDHYQTLPLSFYRQHNTGDLMAPNFGRCQ